MPPTKKQNDKIIDLLVKAYNAEIETVMNYIANAVNLDGIRAEHIKKSLQTDVTEELGHAQQLAARIKVIGGSVPGSMDLKWSQKMMQPPKSSTDVLSVIKGVIKAEETAMKGYEEIIEASADVDPVTEDLAITILADEQDHRREFVGFLKEMEAN